MPDYWCKNLRPKAKTFWRTIKRIENWPTAVGLRLDPKRRKVRVLSFRSGLNILCRGGTDDWAVVAETALLDSYQQGFSFLSQCSEEALVLDLGANIGLFSLLVTQRHPHAQVFAYEPAPPNMRMLEANLRLNPLLADRIYPRLEAVGGSSRAGTFFYNQESPQSSSFMPAIGLRTAKSPAEGSEKTMFRTQVRAFSEIVNSLPRNVTLAKIDIEGGEFEVLRETEASVWDRVAAISIEVHSDPAGKMDRKEFLGRMSTFGFRSTEEIVGPASYFLRRD